MYPSLTANKVMYAVNYKDYIAKTLCNQLFLIDSATYDVYLRQDPVYVHICMYTLSLYYCVTVL